MLERVVLFLLRNWTITVGNGAFLERNGMFLVSFGGDFICFDANRVLFAAF